MKKRSFKRWTELESKWLAECSPNYTIRELASITGRSYNSVSYKIYAMGLVPKSNTKHWTTQETRYLKDNCQSMTERQLSDALGREVSSIRYMLSGLGLQAKQHNHQWNGGDVSVVGCDIEQGVGLNPAALRFGLSYGAVHSFVMRNPTLRDKWDKYQNKLSKLNQPK